ncbi:extracellular solute-binding protein [Aquibacillus albus]|uniref:Maltodextrin-binding protein n=1 Tax=Aquibacillus albus TaxID=1168171 RepID=A0ABS2N4I3_9BACI|nr:extracellular solute-binding protein [Aquibacillus albus]MBM7573016.1 arabinogalactan oligomer/maltooligosaccharide transport system substrate-binding protein [Aquibacillus albus]
MKKNVMILFSLLLTVLLVACGPDRDMDSAQGSNTNTDETDQPEELMIWAPDEQSGDIEEIVTGFTEETGIEVEVVPFAMDEQEEAMSLDGPSGNGPDLFFQPGIGSLSVKGLVQPMEVDQEILDTYSEGSVEALSYEGEVYGLPAVVETLALYYNKDLVSEAPETIADLEAVAEELTDVSNDEYGFLYPATDFYFSFPFMAGYGTDIFAEENSVFNIDDVGLASEEAKKGATLIQSWFEKGYLPNGITMDIVGGLFNDGKVGAVINGPWALNEFKEALGDKLGTAPLPQLENGEYPITFLGTKGWMLSAYTEYPEEATELAIYLTNEDSLQQYFEKTGEMPAKSSILSSDEFQNDPLLTGFGSQLERAQPFPPVPALSAVWDPMADALTFITEGEDVEESLEDAVEAIKQDIEMNYK